MKIYFPFITLVLVLALTGILSPSYGQWQKYNIDTHINWAVLLYAADIDGDGDLDLAAAGERDDDVIWYENNGGTPINWTKRIINGNTDGTIGVYVADIDGDGDLDVAATAYSGDVVVWFENTGGMPINWTNHTIDFGMDGAAALIVADIDSDGKLDIVVTGQNADKVVWYRNVGGTPISWTKHIIDGNLDGATSLEVRDLDGDGDLDVAATGEQDDDVIWYENGGGMPISWTKHTIDADLNGAFAVRVADIDEDDKLDVIATGQYAHDVVWYKNAHPTWTKHTIDGNLDGARCLYISNIDLDNNIDVVVTGYSAGQVVWYEYEHLTWTKHVIDDNLETANDIITADLDGDNDQDIIASSLYGNKVVWYKNPLPNAFGDVTEVYPKYLSPQGDNLLVKGQIINPFNHAVTVFAKFKGDDAAFSDSLFLYDDGMHDDENANDNIWAGTQWFSDFPEDLYLVHLHTLDHSSGIINKSYSANRFSCEGPIVVDSYTFQGLDSIATPGETVNFYLTLKNNGLEATVNTITAVITTKESCISITSDNSAYGHIAPGSSKQSVLRYAFKIDSDCFVDSITMNIDIASKGYNFWNQLFTIEDVTAIEKFEDRLPNKFALHHNYPNPFNPRTIINYELPITNYVELSIYNLLGQKVATLVSGKQKAGFHMVEWDAGDLASGVYYYQLVAGEYVATKKLVLLK